MHKLLIYIVLGGLLFCPAMVLAADDAEGNLAQRVMVAFDFEERDKNYEELPMHWRQVVGLEGFPHYASGRLSDVISRSGRHSFELRPNGGSVGFEYHQRLIPVKTGTDFQISGYVRFSEVRHCRAQLRAVLTDRRGVPIPGSEHHSELVAPTDVGPDGWAKLQVYVPGSFPQVRYIQPSLWVLQEQQWREGVLLDQEILRRDVNAVVWFDDLLVSQLPRVILRTDRPCNVFDGHEEAVLDVEVNGVSSLDYTVRLSVFDAEDRVVHEEAWVLAGVADETRVRRAPLGNLPAGLYRGRLEIMAGLMHVATRELHFAKLAPLGGTPGASGKGFGVLALDAEVGDWDNAVELTRYSGARLLKVPVWRRREGQGGAIFSEENFDDKLIVLQRNNIELVATFSEVPDSLTRQLSYGQRTLLDVLSRDASLWQDQVAFVLAQYARQVPFWQIGGEAASGQLWDGRVQRVVQTMRRQFDQLVSNTVLAIPLSATCSVDQSQTATDYVALSLDAQLNPEASAEYVRDARARGLEHIWASIEPLPAEYYSREDVLIDFAKRIAAVKKGSAEAVFVPHPWVVRRYNARVLTEPTELLLVLRTLADYMGGARYGGEFLLEDGARMLIFDRDGEGCLLAWNEQHDRDSGVGPREFCLTLGDNVEEVDLFGNRREVVRHGTRQCVTLTDWPVVLTGVNTSLARLRASVEVAPRVIDASISGQELLVRFKNTFRTSISGQARFDGAGSSEAWSIEPTAVNFTLSGGEVFEQPIQIRFPRNELGGEKMLRTQFKIDAEQMYDIVVDAPFEVRLSGVDVSLFARRLSSRDLEIQIVVANESDEEVSLMSYAHLPNQDRIERAIGRLRPGMAAKRSFPVPEAIQWLGRNIRVSLYDPKGMKRINYEVQVN